MYRTYTYIASMIDTGIQVLYVNSAEHIVNYVYLCLNLNCIIASCLKRDLVWICVSAEMQEIKFDTINRVVEFVFGIKWNLLRRV